MVADVIFSVTVVAREVGFENPLHLCFTRGWIVKLVKSQKDASSRVRLEIQTTAPLPIGNPRWSKEVSASQSHNLQALQESRYINECQRIVNKTTQGR